MYYCPFTHRKLMPNPNKEKEHRSDKGLVYDQANHRAYFLRTAPQYMLDSVEALRIIKENNFVFAFANAQLFTSAFKLDTLRLCGYGDKEKAGEYYVSCLDLSRIIFDTEPDNIQWVAYKQTPNLCLVELLTYTFSNDPKHFDFPQLKNFATVEDYLGRCVEAFTSVRTRSFTVDETLFLRYLCCPSLDHFLIHLGDIIISDGAILYTRCVLAAFDFTRIKANESKYVLYNYIHLLNSNCCDFLDEPTTLNDYLATKGKHSTINIYKINIQKGIAQAFPCLYASQMNYQYYALNPLNASMFHPDYLHDLITEHYTDPDAFRDQLPLYKYLSTIYENIDSNSDYLGADEDDYISYMCDKCSKFKEFARAVTG